VGALLCGRGRCRCRWRKIEDSEIWIPLPMVDPSAYVVFAPFRARYNGDAPTVSSPSRAWMLAVQTYRPPSLTASGSAQKRIPLS
jgi:hypothetical protein